MTTDNLVLISKVELQDMLNDAVSSANQTAVIVSPPVKSQTKFMSIADMCEMFSVSRVTISTWMKSGKLPYKKIQRRVFFLLSEVLEAIPSFSLKNVESFQKSIPEIGKK